MPDPATVQGEHILNLWQGAWIAALVTGVVVWGLIFWAIWRYRRRSDDEIPVQTRYNLPLEIFYTIAPIIMVVVFFAHTVETQNFVLDDDACRSTTPSRSSASSGRGPSTTASARWTAPPTTTVDDEFPYYVVRLRRRHRLAHPDARAAGRRDHPLQPALARRHPRLRRPGFLMKMDVIPGRVNHYAVTPTDRGHLRGKCYELCGVYHSRMLFNVKVVSQEEYDAYLAAARRTPAATSEQPLLGGEYASTQAGLESGDESEEGAE